MFVEWESGLRAELSDKRRDLARLESQPIDPRAVFDGARSRVMSVLERESALVGLFTHQEPDANRIHSPSPSTQDTRGISLADFEAVRGTENPRPAHLEFPSGEMVEVVYWRNFLLELANYLIRKGSLSTRDCPLPSVFRSPNTPSLIVSRIDSSVRKELSNGTFINVNMSLDRSIRQARYLLERFDEDPSEFYLHLTMPESGTLASSLRIVPETRRVRERTQSLPDSGWHLLTSPEMRNLTGHAPSRMKLPFGEERAISTWAQVIAEIANWLIREGKLSHEDCPLSLGRSQRYLINTTPHHPSGRRFDSNRELVNGTYVNTNLGRAHRVVSNGRNLLNAFDVDPSQFQIRLQ